MWIATIAGKQLLAEQSHFSDNGIKSFLKLQTSFYIPLVLPEFFLRDIHRAKLLQAAKGSDQESRREGWTDARSALGFCLGSGLFGSYNSD